MTNNFIFVKIIIELSCTFGFTVKYGMVVFVKENDNNDHNPQVLQTNEVSASTNAKTKMSKIPNNQKQYASGFMGTISNFEKTKDKKNLPLPVTFDENIEQSIEECEKYNKKMWEKYSNNNVVENINDEYKTSFGQVNYEAKNFKYQCEFYNKLIDKFIDEHHLKPPERKRIWSVFFYILMGLAIAFFCLCIFAPGLLISLATILGISVIIATKIIIASYILVPVIGLIFFKLARYVSWRQNDYKEGTNPERYFKYNEELKRHKIECVALTGERFKTEDFEYNYNEADAKQSPLYNYYHDENGGLKKNTKSPYELLLSLKKAYEIPKEFKNTESIAYGTKEDQDDLVLD